MSDMLSQFPANELDVPATKDFVRAESAITRTELRSEMATLGKDLMTYVHAEIVSSMRWTMGIFLTVQTLVIALILGFT